MFRLLVLLLANLCFASTFFAQKTIHNLQELLDLADEKSIAAQTDDLNILKAKKAKLAAQFAVTNPSWTNTFNFTNNTQLPVNLFPAEAFGGQKGEYREVQTGVQFNTAFSSNLEIKLFDFQAWKDLSLAKLNIEISELDQQLNRKTLHENIAAAYFNIIQLQAQLESTQRNLAIADTLLQVVENKYREGLAKQQDINDSRVNVLSTQENARQIEFLIGQQIISLKILADIPANDSLRFSEKIDAAGPALRPEIAPTALLLRTAVQREQSALVNLKKANAAFWPSLSFVANNAYNQYNPDFTLFGGNWIHSQYLGLRLNLNLPNANSIANQSKAKFDRLIAQKNTEQTLIQTALKRQQLESDWQKSVSQLKNNAQILALQRDTYLKNKSLYDEGQQAIDRTLNSFSAMVNAEYNLISSQVATALAQAKIDINNHFN